MAIRYAKDIVDLFFEKPIFEVKDLMEKININRSTAIRILKKFTDLTDTWQETTMSNGQKTQQRVKEYKFFWHGTEIPIFILKKHKGQGSKPSSYKFAELLNIAEK